MQAASTKSPNGGYSDRFGRWGAVVSTVVIVLASLGIIEGHKAVTAPWAVNWMPGPKLIGSWEGHIQARQGATYRLFLDLRYADERSTSSVGNNLAGTARVCTQAGITYDYTVYGGVNAFSQHMDVRLVYGDPKLSGLGFTLKGLWDGAPLRVIATDNPFDPDGAYRPGSPSSTADPDDSFLPLEMRHATLTEFERNCRQLAVGR